MGEFTGCRVTGTMKSGRCQTDVVETAGIFQSTVSRLWKRHISKGNASRSPVEDCLRITTSSGDRFVA